MNSMIPEIAMSQGYFQAPDPPFLKVPLDSVGADTFFFRTLVDMNGDDKIDLFVLTVTTTTDPCLDPVELKYYENQGTTECMDFSSPPVVSPFGIPASITALSFMDLDGDGDQDLLSLEWCIDRIYYVENKGTPTMPNFTNSPILTNPFSFDPTGIISANVTFGDIDNDGDQDIFYNGRTGGEFLYQENTGTATSPQFGPRQNDPFGLQLPKTPQGPLWIRLLDWDCDGDLDLLNSLPTGTGTPNAYRELFLYENTGTPQIPQFGPAIATGDSIFIINTVDLDGDGDQDALSQENISQHPDCVIPPEAGFIYEKTDLTVTFTDTSLQKGTDCRPTQWHWNFGDGNTSTDQNPVHIYNAPGPYEIKLIVTDVKGTDSIEETIILTNLEHINADNYLTLFPNPAKKTLNLEWQQIPGNAQIQFSIYDLYGRQVSPAQTWLPHREERMIIDLSHLTDGIYWVRLTSDKWVLTRQFVKQGN
jgi:PKD repeat protein